MLVQHQSASASAFLGGASAPARVEGGAAGDHGVHMHHGVALAIDKAERAAAWSAKLAPKSTPKRGGGGKSSIKTLRTRGKRPALPGIRVFAFRPGKNKDKPDGMNLDAIRGRRLGRMFRLFHGDINSLRGRVDEDEDGETSTSSDSAGRQGRR
jgi:hypothetical protein